MWFKVIDMIEKLEKEIISIDYDIAYLDSRIDALECYQHSDDKLEDLIDKSNLLEKQKSELVEKQKKYMQMITEMHYSLDEIQENINSLNKNKEILNDEIKKVDRKSDMHLTLIAEINCTNKLLNFFETKLKESNKKSNMR